MPKVRYLRSKGDAMTISKLELELQTIGKEIVDQDVYCCVSYLVQGILQLAADNEGSAPPWLHESPAIYGNIDDEGERQEPLEHWIVSSWLAGRLKTMGEPIDEDFYGLCLWGRTCSGQAILLDSPIRYLALERYKARNPEKKVFET